MDRQSGSLWNLAVGFRRWYAAAIMALAAGTLLAYMAPLVTRATIDAVVAEMDGRPISRAETFAWWFAGSSSIASKLWLSAAVIAALAAASGGFMYLKGRWTAAASEGIVRQLRDRLYDHLQHLPCSYHDDAETGDLVQRCTSDVETIRHFLAMQVIEIGRAALLLGTVIPIMLWLDVRMAIVSLLGAPVILTFGTIFFLRIKPVFLAMDEAEGRMTTVLQENLTGIRVVRAFARQDYEIDKFADCNRDYRDRNYRLIRLLSIYWPLSDLMVVLQQAAVLLYGAWLTLNGQLSVGTLVAFLMFVSIYIFPLRQMGRILADLGKAIVALGRIDEVLSTEQESDVIQAGGEALPKQQQLAQADENGKIQFDRVSYGYNEDGPVLEDVSFTVEPGQTLAILGPSGSGKSTIVSLLLRLYDGWSGTICLDGREIQTAPRKTVRSQISVVMQEPFLYSKTVRENIALSSAEADERELFDAARTAGIHDAIVDFDHGYETLVGERGVTLSGGQRQRVALARALLKRPTVLILDDALSAVDTETESLILEALRSRHGRHTTLVIAHRLSTLRLADCVMILDKGRVVQSGSHKALMRDSAGPYRRLWDIQRDPHGTVTEL